MYNLDWELVINGGGGENDEGTFCIVFFEREFHIKFISSGKHRVSKTSEWNFISVVVVVVVGKKYL